MRRLWVLCRIALLALFVFQGPIVELVGHCDETSETSSHDEDRKCHCPTSCACGCLALPQADAPRDDREPEYLGAFVWLEPPPVADLLPLDIVRAQLKVPKQLG